MFHSDILASLNFNQNTILFSGIGEQPYTEMLFWQISNIFIYVKIVVKNTRSTYECVVIVKSRGQGPKKMESYGTNLSHTFNMNLDLVPWIGE